MKNLRIAVLSALFATLLGLVALGVLEVVLPRFLNLASVQEYVFSELRHRIQCQSSFDAVNFTLFPRPHLTVREARLWRSGVFEVEMKALTLYPRLLPLLAGEVQISAIHMHKPEIHLAWPSGEPGAEKGGDAGELELVKQIKLLSSLDAIIEKMDFLKLAPLAPLLKVRDGRVSLARNGQPLLTLEHLQADGKRRPGYFELSLGSASSHCERVSLDVALNLENDSSSGRLMFAGLKLDRLSSSLLRDAPFALGPGSSNLAFEYWYELHKGLRVEIQGAVPQLTLTQGDRAIGLEGATFEGELQVQDQKAQLTVKALDLVSPGLNAWGSFSYDVAAQDVRLEVEGSNVDAAGVRELTLGLAGDKKSVQDVFEVVVSGFVPHITYKASGRTMSELGRLENSLIVGNMERGRIFIPPAGLEVEDAQGEVEIVEGVLHARKLRGRSGRSEARSGWLTLALKKDEAGDGPFHLDLEMDADLSQLPPVLERTVKDVDFQRELALMEAITGKATGRLILGETLKSVKTLVDAQSFELSGRYQRIPYAVSLKGGRFWFEGKFLSVEGLTGTVGQSSFEPLFLALDWGDPSDIELASGNSARLALGEIYPWLISFPRVKAALNTMESLNGTLLVQEASLSGPFFRPAEWQYQVRTVADSVAMKHTFFPDVVFIPEGRLIWSPDTLSVGDCRATLLDSTLSLSGGLQFNGGSLSSTDLTLGGSLGPNALQWVSDRIGLPRELRLKAPAGLSMARFGWRKDGRSTFAGTISLARGSEVNLDLVALQDNLTINKLVIRDPLSTGTFSITKIGKMVDLSFNGLLSSATLDRVLLENTLLTGTMKGRFQAKIPADRPMDSKVRGELELEGLKSAWKTKVPLEVRKASLQADGNRLTVRSAQFQLEESSLNLGGYVDFSPNGLILNLDLVADTLNWERVKEFVDRELRSPADQGPNAQGASRDGGRTTRGVLKIKADHLYWANHHFAPVELTVDLRPEGNSFDFSKASVCGISCPARVHVSKDSTELTARLEATDSAIDETLMCLWERKGVVDGRFSLDGTLMAAGNADELISSLHGTVKFEAKDGRIFPIGFIAKIFSVLNITEIYRGQFPDLIRRGCAYDSISATGTIKNGVMTLDNSIVNAQCMKMVWRGTIDIAARKADLIVVVAPLRTVDKIIGNVPILGHMLNGTLISFPVRVSGDLSDPDVVPMSPSALGSGFVEFLKRTMEVPFRLMEPLR